jgi:hypothetical protein
VSREKMNPLQRSTREEELIRKKILKSSTRKLKKWKIKLRSRGKKSMNKMIKFKT